ncbi:DUF3109 family protein [Flavilitoribacter nigricans]|uniref:DUF3109 family protein n=1 Tax=Flavilitoribacter nigricans (strain ATCC 23147 / DSM 23189 / NBRC 102662 / NCIMB 1420 / SS-2) TaxID=1122177 RepID=A0A2D0N848_FLAN2|nr:DUF3109 family protein [Flavilitoribacter nigricans]PHN04691.1 hypothetical protein CRP01_19435 [Flavilitoribacter nigricans DSM 23189 = NBRC 102662]
MIIIQEVLISEDVVEEHFICNLDACKGACCWEGDFGAPLEAEEIEILEREYERIAPFLDEAGKEVMAAEGLYSYYKEEQDYGTPLLENGACTYLTYDENGIAKCGIEKAYEAGATDFKKPISCHLYPIRIERAAKTDYDLMNYDRWDICSAACALGDKHRVPVFQFVKEALIRKYGSAFFEELVAVAEALKQKN